MLMITVAFLGAIWIATGVAGAQSSDDGYGPVSTTIAPTTVLSPVEPEVLSETLPRRAADAGSSAGSGLAFTGGDITALVAIGGVALIAGGSILMARRNRTTQPV